MRFDKRENFWGEVVCLLVVVGFLWTAPQLSAKDRGEKAGESRDDNCLKMKFVWCPPGNFTMGSPESEAHRSSTEDQVKATLPSGFWLGETEVTQRQWQTLMGTEPWKDQRYVREADDSPANYVSWEDAMAFCKKLTQQERSTGRLSEDWEYTLPTETQWEYACRAGTITAYCFGDDANNLGDYAWYNGLSVGDRVLKSVPDNERYAHAVGKKKPNAWGFFDMHGNVSEWCQEWYSNKLPGGPGPRLIVNGRTKRGGAWGDFSGRCRSASRVGSGPSNRWYDTGFRVALVPSHKPEEAQSK